MGIIVFGDIVDWVVCFGYEFNFIGYFGLFEMDVEVIEVVCNYIILDNFLEEELCKCIIMLMGFFFEIVDNGFVGDFVISVVVNNVFLVKCVMDI